MNALPKKSLLVADMSNDQEKRNYSEHAEYPSLMYTFSPNFSDTSDYGDALAWGCVCGFVFQETHLINCILSH